MTSPPALTHSQGVADATSGMSKQQMKELKLNILLLYFRYQGRASLIKAHWKKTHLDQPYPENHVWPTLRNICSHRNIELGEISRVVSPAASATPSQWTPAGGFNGGHDASFIIPTSPYMNYSSYQTSLYHSTPPPMGMSVHPGWMPTNHQPPHLIQPINISNAQEFVTFLSINVPSSYGTTFYGANDQPQPAFSISPPDHWDTPTPLVPTIAAPNIVDEEWISLFSQPYTRETGYF
jgi:hypothetical protein